MQILQAACDIQVSATCPLRPQPCRCLQLDTPGLQQQTHTSVRLARRAKMASGVADEMSVATAAGGGCAKPLRRPVAMDARMCRAARLWLPSSCASRTCMWRKG